MASVVARAYNRVWGVWPQRVQRQNSWSGGEPPEAESLFSLRRLNQGANLPFSWLNHTLACSPIFSERVKKRGGNCLLLPQCSYGPAIIFRTISTKFLQNRPGFVDDVTKTFGVFFGFTVPIAVRLPNATLSFTKYCSDIIQVSWKTFKLAYRKFIQDNCVPNFMRIDRVLWKI